MPKFLEISQQNDITVGTIIRNEVYLGKENLRLASEQNIKALVKLNLSVTQGFKKDKYIFYYKKDLDIFYCRTSYVAIRKACHGKKNVGKIKLMLTILMSKNVNPFFKEMAIISVVQKQKHIQYL